MSEAEDLTEIIRIGKQLEIHKYQQRSLMIPGVILAIIFGVLVGGTGNLFAALITLVVLIPIASSITRISRKIERLQEEMGDV